MTAVLTRRGQPDLADDGLRLVVGRNKRRPLLAVGSLAVIAASAAAFTSFYARAGHEVRVLVVAHPVAQGDVIVAGDLAVARVALSRSLAPIRADDVSSVVGRTATVDLLPGTLLTRAELAHGWSPPPGTALVGVTAKAGQLPAGGLSRGETVDVVLTSPTGTPDVAATAPLSGSAGSPEPAAPGSLIAVGATVSEVVPGNEASGTDAVVTLLLPVDDVGAVANASAAGQAALVIVGPPS